MYIQMTKEKYPDDSFNSSSNNNETPVVIEGVIPSGIGENTSNTLPLDGEVSKIVMKKIMEAQLRNPV